MPEDEQPGEAGSTGSEYRVHLCFGPNCTERGSRALMPILERAVREAGLSDRVEILATTCRNRCDYGPSLNVYPGPVLTANTTTLTPEGSRSPVRTEHGLYFFARSDLDSAPGFDRVFVPGRAAPSVTDPRVRSWAREEGLELEFFHADAPAGFPFDATLSDLAEHENALVARFTARLLEYPIGHLGLAGGGWPFAPLLRPLAAGLLGLALAVLVDRLLGPATKRFRRSSEGTGASAKPVAEARC